MEKLRLDLNDLRIESFDTTSPNTAGFGTVFAQTGTTTTEQGINTCGGCINTNSCDPSGDYTCDCQNQSEGGYASCGTTCQCNETCVNYCYFAESDANTICVTGCVSCV